jgi:hypothetical protein
MLTDISPDVNLHPQDVIHDDTGEHGYTSSTKGSVYAKARATPINPLQK